MIKNVKDFFSKIKYKRMSAHKYYSTYTIYYSTGNPSPRKQAQEKDNKKIS